MELTFRGLLWPLVGLGVASLGRSYWLMAYGGICAYFTWVWTLLDICLVVLTFNLSICRWVAADRSLSTKNYKIHTSQASLILTKFIINDINIYISK